MTSYKDAMPHGTIEEVFPDVFFVTGTMCNEFFGSDWCFGRNMTVVRENGNLTIINSVRLNDEGLAALDALGKVVNVVRIGDMHGVDDPFYVDHYKATFWALPGMGIQDGLKVDKELVEGGEMPFANSSLFVFKTTKRPEAIIRLDREGGIMISCDALQNWEEPDPYTDEETVAKMKEFGFYSKANPGLAWVQASEPQPDDFVELKKVPFKHALCGHGTPLRDTAMEDYHATWARMFKV
ncbi:MAG: hypothetical protein R3240_06210 [Gammaproteobacteria bacterium]|nr:hypothetical protein [Gammaproteobacteria bacterium]